LPDIYLYSLEANPGDIELRDPYILDLETVAPPAVVETGSSAFPFVNPRLRRKPDIISRRRIPIHIVEPIRRILPIAAELLESDSRITTDEQALIIALYAMGEINEAEMAALLAA